MNARATAALAEPTSSSTTLADVVQLGKPRVTVLVIVTGLGGMWLASRTTGANVDWRTALAALLGLSLIVSAANALNMYLERDVDALMERTRDRPLPAGRMAPATALWIGIAAALVALPLLALTVNVLTALLSLVAFVLYVGVYTPLKQVSPIALAVGAVPGAAPPLLGWTAATGEIGAAGLALFAVLFFWQLPHFLAIATFRRDDYARAGIKVLPVVRGHRVTRVRAVIYSVALMLSSLALVPLGVHGPVYLINAVVLGGLFVWFSVRGLSAEALLPAGGIRWARSLFAVSLLYLPMLIAAMMVST
jgi:protoheme IX farnesyltransferase